MNWYHRVERRYVEYGNSFEATRAFGLFRSLYDVVYNMNMSHLSPEVETVFERLGDAGVRSACTPFLVYRGRTRHELGLEGLLRQVALAAKFHHATWGPDELFWGELYASRRVPCKPTLARPGTRDEYSGCVGRELLRDDAYDFLLFSLPDNDHHTHKHGPEGMPESIALADAAFGEIVDEAGGIDAFCDTHAVILMADHAQTRGHRRLRRRRGCSAPSGGCSSPTRSARRRPSWRSRRRPARPASTCSPTAAAATAPTTTSARGFAMPRRPT